MEYDSLLNAIKNQFSKKQSVFFEYAWRDTLGEILEKESKYEKLIEWIDKELELCGDVANVLSPADKTESTTLAMMNTYKELMQKIAVLVHNREVLLDNRTTNKMRDNIEYTLCKFYNIHYNKELNCYV